jgi:hypothetical protein
LISTQLSAFEAKLETTLGSRLDSLESRLKELNKVVSAPPPAAASNADSPKKSDDNTQKVESLMEKTSSRLDQISTQLGEIFAKMEKESVFTSFKKK